MKLDLQKVLKKYNYENINDFNIKFIKEINRDTKISIYEGNDYNLYFECLISGICKSRFLFSYNFDVIEIIEKIEENEGKIKAESEKQFPIFKTFNKILRLHQTKTFNEKNIEYISLDFKRKYDLDTFNTKIHQIKKDIVTEKFTMLKDDFIFIIAPENFHYIKVVKLYRIKSNKTFFDIKEGDLGGYIEFPENISQKGNCWVYEEGKLGGYCELTDNASIFNNARVIADCYSKENPEISAIKDFVKIGNNANVFGKFKIRDYAEVRDEGYILNVSMDNNACVYESGTIINKEIDDKIESVFISGNANIFGNANILGRFYIADNASIFGNTELENESSKFVEIFGEQKIYKNDSKFKSNNIVSSLENKIEELTEELEKYKNNTEIRELRKINSENELTIVDLKSEIKKLKNRLEHSENQSFENTLKKINKFIEKSNERL